MGLRRGGKRSLVWNYISPIFSFRCRRDDVSLSCRNRRRRARHSAKVTRQRQLGVSVAAKKEQRNFAFLPARTLFIDVYAFARACTQCAAAAGASAWMHSGDFPGQVPQRYSRGCTRHRSWCFQRLYPHPAAACALAPINTQTHARAHVCAPLYAETRRLSYFLTIASRSPRWESMYRRPLRIIYTYIFSINNITLIFIFI